MRNSVFIALLLLASSSLAAMQFDGIDDYLTIANESNFDQTQYVTVSLWMNAESGARCPITKGDLGSTNAWGMDISGFVPGQVEFVVGRNPNYVNRGVDIPVGWFHFVGVFNKDRVGDDKIRIYLNGVNTVGTVTKSGTTNAITACNDPITIGTLSLTGSWYKGQMDDVRVYSRALSDTEIFQLYASRSRLHMTDGQIGYWRLDDGVDGIAVSPTANVIKDSSGGGNPGTGTSPPTWRASSFVNYP